MEFDRAKYSTNISNLKDLVGRIKSIITDPGYPFDSSKGLMVYYEA